MKRKRFSVVLLCVLCVSLLSSCETARGLYDNYPGGTYSYRISDGRLITVTVGEKTPAASTAK